MRSNLIAICILLCGIHSTSAQNSNPFELLWRKDTTGLSMRIVNTPKPELVKDVTPDTTVPELALKPVPSDTTSAPPVEKADSTVSSTDTLQSSDSTTYAHKPDTMTSTTHAVDSDLPVTTRRTPPGETPLALVLIFGVVFSLLAWGLSLNRELLQKIYRAAMNENLSSLLYREQRFATTQYLYYTIYIVFFLNGGMFLHFLAREFEWTSWAFQSVWSCIAMVTIIYTLRHLSLSILGSTYPIGKETTHFSFNILLHNILLGVTLIPVNLLLAFGPDGFHKVVAVFGLIVCCLLYLIRQFRGLLIGGSIIGANPFRFFIYLCAVEILPLFTLVKFFHN